MRTVRGRENGSIFHRSFQTDYGDCLAGGMVMDEDGWVVPGYKDCTYLIFREEGGELEYLTGMMENDCKPGDEVFEEDLRVQLQQKDIF